MELVDAIQEIVMQEPDISWLSPEYKEILDNQETIRQDVKRRAKSLEFLVGIVTDLFVDWSRLQGIDARSKIPQIQEVIMGAAENFDSISEAFFRSSSKRR
jgi:Bardet-Biedl syndrome 7 protein